MNPVFSFFPNNHFTVRNKVPRVGLIQGPAVPFACSLQTLNAWLKSNEFVELYLFTEFKFTKL